MVRRLAVLAVVTAALALVALPQAQAIEQGLAGIRLGQPALDLLDLKPYGPPQFIGPVGAVTTWGIVAPEATMPAGTVPGGGYGAAPMAPGVPRTATPTLGGRRTGVPGGLRISLGGRGGFGSSAAAPTPRPPGFGLGLGAAQPLAAPAAAFAGAGGGPIYWLYSQGGAQVAVGIDPDGKVSSIVVSGRSYPAAKTEGGVRLGDSYTSVLDKYGFPDSTQNAGGGLVLQYANAGLTFTLQSMRVQTIALATPAFSGGVVPGTPGRPAAPPAGYGARALGAAAAPRAGSASGARTAPPRLRIRLGGRRGM